MEPSDAVPPTPTPTTFTLVGRGIVAEPPTSDLWVHGTVAYTGTDDIFATGIVANTLFVWDVSNPATPVGWWAQAEAHNRVLSVFGICSVSGVGWSVVVA